MNFQIKRIQIHVSSSGGDDGAERCAVNLYQN